MDYNNLDFFGYNEDQRKLLSLLRDAKKEKSADTKNKSKKDSKSKTKLVLMCAPSFVVDFDFKNFVPLMHALGFDKVTELTFGAKIVNQHYHKYIHNHYSAYIHTEKKLDKNFKNKFISSVCPASVELVKHRHPKFKKYLLPFVSPMVAMAKIVKKNFPSHTIVFLAPCSAKKFEASKLKKFKGEKLIEVSITFAELKQIVAKEKPKIKKSSSRSKKSVNRFDSFYNDYTKVYPLSGGLSSTLHYKGILHKNEMVWMDGATNLDDLFKNKQNKVFYDVLFCKGGCIGGPGVASQAPLFIRKQRVLSYRNASKKIKDGKKVGLEKYTKGIDFSKEF